MSQQSEDFAKGVEIILEVIMFENWLRFYFLKENTPEEEDLFLNIPEQGMQRIGELYPHLSSLAEEMNGKKLTLETSRTAICTHVATEIDGKRMPQNLSSTIFDSTTFQVALHVFNTWVQSHEKQLDQGFLEFGAWKTFFAQWRATDEVKEWSLQMLATTTMPNASDTSNTVQ